MRFKLNFLLFLLVTAILVGSTSFSYFTLRSELEARYEERKQELAKRQEAAQ